MSSPDSDHDLRVNDRITILPGQARSAHTRIPLTSRFTIDITSIRPDLDGAVEVTGIELTTRGAWRASAPSRTVILAAGSYTAPIRVGDTVRYPNTGEIPVVTAIHERADGTALADLLFASGSTGSGYRLVDLEHLTRPAAAVPAQQPCLRHHDPALPCARCAEATDPVTTGCNTSLCAQPAANLVVCTLRLDDHPAKALCPGDTDRYRARHHACGVRAIPLEDGTTSVRADGTQIATCRHCGHQINLYPALLGRAQPWRDGESEETGRCRAAQDRHAIRMVHEPAVTLAAFDYARAASTCGTTGNGHNLADCPARRA